MICLQLFVLNGFGIRLFAVSDVYSSNRNTANTLHGRCPGRCHHTCKCSLPTSVVFHCVDILCSGLERASRTTAVHRSLGLGQIPQIRVKPVSTTRVNGPS